MTITEGMVERAAKAMCLDNAQPECLEAGCNAQTCQYGMRDFGNLARTVLEVALSAAPSRDQQPDIRVQVIGILKGNLILTSIGGEPCIKCGETVDYVFKVKDGCIEKCADLIAEALKST